MFIGSFRRLTSLAMMIGLALIATRAQAQFVWTAAGSGNWSNAGNWTGGAPVSGATTTLTFGAGTYTATDDIATNPFVLNNITFGASGTATIAASGSQVLSFGGTSPSITMGAGNGTITAPVALGANLTVGGATGTLTFSGGVNDNGGGFNVVQSSTGSTVFAGGTSTFGQLSIQAGSVTVVGGTLALTLSNSGSTTASGLQIGNASGQTGSFTANGGATINVSENVYIGDAAGSSGTLTVNGAGTTLTNTIGGLSGRFAVGNNGNGTLNITNGGVVNAPFVLTNRLGGTTASILVDGAGSQLNVTSVGTLTGNIQVCGNTAGSTGTLTISNGGAVNQTSLGVAGTQFVVAGAANTTGTLNILSGGTFTTDANSFFGATATATATVNISGAGSAFTSSGGFVIFAGGGSPSGTANLNMSAGATFTGSTVSFAGNGNTNGMSTAVVDNSTMNIVAQLQVGSFTGEVGALTIQNGGTLNVTGTSFIGAAFSGSTGGTGTLTITGAGSTLNQNGSIQLGTSPGGVGTLNVLNGGTVNVSGNTIVGPSGGPPTTVGTINISGAGSTFNGGPFVIFGGGASPGGTGNLNISAGGLLSGGTVSFAGNGNTNGTGIGIVDDSTLNVTSQLQLGATNGGTGTLTIQNGGTLNVTGTAFIGAYVAASASGTGTITITGAGSNYNQNGAIQLGTSTGGTGTLNVLNGGTATVNGTLFAGVAGTDGTNPPGTGVINVSGVGSTLTLTPGNALVVSGGATPGGIGSLNVSNGGVVTADAAFFTNNTGGTSTAVVSNNGVLIINDQLVLAGAGNATLSILNGGKVLVGGNTFAAIATSITGSITLTGFGSTMNALGTTSLAGQGGVASGSTASITANAGTSVNLAGPTFLYAGSSIVANGGPFGSFIVGGLGDGTLSTSTGTVSIGAGSTLTINTNGTDVVTNGGNLAFTGTISGAGGVTKTGPGTQYLLGANTYTGPTNINGGILNFFTLNNLGTASAINFNGGTLQYNAGGNTTDISAAPTVVTFLAGGATIDTGGNNVTFANPVGNGGNGGLTKVGAGTLTLAGANTYLGGTNVLGGTLSVASDANLGSGNVTGAAAATLDITGTTSTTKSFAMGGTSATAGGTIAVSSTQTVTFVGGVVSGAVLTGVGPGALAAVATDPTAGAEFIGSSSTASLAITSNSVKDRFVNFSNGGPMAVAANVNTGGAGTVVNFNGFTNLGSGTLTIGGGSELRYANFQSSGTLTVSPAVVGSGNSTLLTNAGTSPMYFNGGSETFIGTAATVGPSNNPNFVAGIDLHGANAIVQGGLFVNNGYVVDSSTAGTATVVADFGSLVQGAGFFQNTVITQNGGRFKAGNCPGETSFGNFVMGPGGVNNDIFYINNATGTAGPVADAAGNVSGWSLVKTVKQAVGTTTTSGDFTWTATPSNPMLVALDTLVNPSPVGVDVVGPMANFDPTKAYSWLAGQWTGTYSGPTDPAALDAATAFNTSAFVNQIEGSFGWSLDLPDDKLFLTYTPSPVPEPGTLALVGATGLVAGWWRRRKAAGAKVS